MAQTLSQAGPSIQLGPAGYWLAALSEEERQAALAESGEAVGHWDGTFGDRINQVVFIGIDMNSARIASDLDECLLTEAEMNADWSLFADELPNAAEAV